MWLSGATFLILGWAFIASIFGCSHVAVLEPKREAGDASLDTLTPHVASTDIYQSFRAKSARVAGYIFLRSAAFGACFASIMGQIISGNYAVDSDVNSVKNWNAVEFSFLGLAYLLEVFLAAEVTKYQIKSVEQGQSQAASRIFKPIISPITVIIANSGTILCCALLIAAGYWDKLNNQAVNIGLPIAAGVFSLLAAAHYLYWACQPRIAPIATGQPVVLGQSAIPVAAAPAYQPLSSAMASRRP